MLASPDPAPVTMLLIAMVNAVAPSTDSTIATTRVMRNLSMDVAGAANGSDDTLGQIAATEDFDDVSLELRRLHRRSQWALRGSEIHRNDVVVADLAEVDEIKSLQSRIALVSDGSKQLIDVEGDCDAFSFLGAQHRIELFYRGVFHRFASVRPDGVVSVGVEDTTAVEHVERMLSVGPPKRRPVAQRLLIAGLVVLVWIAIVVAVTKIGTGG